MCAMSAASSLRDRQSVWDFELEDLENWADLKGPDICFAGGNRHEQRIAEINPEIFAFFKENFWLTKWSDCYIMFLALVNSGW